MKILLPLITLLGAYSFAAIEEVKLPKDFRSWTQTKSMVIPDKQHGLYGFHNIYANAKAMEVQKKGTGSYPDGSTFVISFYEVVAEGNGPITQGNKMQDLIMVKQKAATKTGGWAFAAFDAGGKPKTLDVVTNCFQCHDSGAKGTDFVFSKFVP